MSDSLISQFEQKYAKKQIVSVRSGDTVKVHQKIREGNKERIQVFQGLVIRVDNKNSLGYRVTVRKLASGVGVEKSFLLNSPLVTKVEVTKRSKVRRNYLSYMRDLTGKATRLSGVDFNKDSVNKIDEAEDEVKAEIAEPATEKEVKDSDVIEDKAVEVPDDTKTAK
ncbi:MAG TPA: 50S ribosomal protein L19 [Candidatus Saccharimonadia bacterium]|nr:50S ribosomal protein L19 [Candidatus Saccharimonadia bacterium]